MTNAMNVRNNILYGNLVIIRWIAIVGQLVAILFVYFYLNIIIPIATCLFIIVISILINLISFLSKNKNKFLSEKEAYYFLIYDTSQLAVLLYFTGGIYNPFSLLLIAPVVISASYLKIIYSIVLSLYSILLVIFLSFFHLEIQWNDFFSVPILFTYGLVLSFIISIIFIAIYVYILANSSRNIANALNQTQLALINQKKLSEVGALAAAAVHELSTPLNTIFLILNDLKKEEILKKDKRLISEIKLLESQANRSKDILYNLSKNPDNIKDSFFDQTTLSNLIKINFDKFKKEKVFLDMIIQNNENEPKIKFTDEIMYGIGNIVQNAIEYANKIVTINLSWDNKIFIVKISDDGLGFPKDILDKIGTPYISKNKIKQNMGLGIFISKNFIENVGGKISFNNKEDSNGSIVTIHLNRNLN